MNVTETTTIIQEVSIWAFPKRDYINSEWQYTGEWEYKVQTDRPYVTGAVEVDKQEICLTVPSGINLTLAAIKTLETAIVDELKSSRERIKSLEDMIQNLKLLTYDGETVGVHSA